MRAGNHMALDNIRERLMLFFDAEAKLETRIEGGRYRVRHRHSLPDGPRMSTPAELRVFIADDEAPARARLKELLADVRGEIATSVVGEAANGLEVIERLPASGARGAAARHPDAGHGRHRSWRVT